MKELQRISLRTVIVAICVLSCVISVPCRADTDLKLIAPMDAADSHKDSYFRDEPIWVAVTLSNEGETPLTIFVDDTDRFGIRLKPAETEAAGFEMRRNHTETLDFMGAKVTIQPHMKKVFPVLLNFDYEFVKDGEYRFKIEMSVANGASQLELKLRTEIAIKVKDKMNVKDLAMVMEQIRHDLQSSESVVRWKAVRAVQFIPTEERLPLIKSAVRDRDSGVALQAENALQWLDDKSPTTVPTTKINDTPSSN